MTDTKMQCAKNALFEKWIKKTFGKADIGDELYDSVNDAWHASAQVAQGRIDELEKQVTVQCIDLDRLIGALEKIAVFGSNCAPYFGNSEVNMIARQALAYGVPKITEVN
jgi:hypothetical protein